MEAFALRWASSDSTVAVVDSLGAVHPRAIGRFVVTATAGGWRNAMKTLTVGPAESRTVRIDTWDSGLDEGFWRPFGEPLPVIVTSPTGVPALWHHGDSTYASGVYSRSGFDARGGFGVEVAVSTPLTLPQWQDLQVTLQPVDRAALARWDHRTGMMPQTYQQEWKTCGASYPALDGPSGAHGIVLRAGGNRTAAVDSAAARGTSWTWRLQILPDGRCALAVNGRPAAIIDRPMSLGDSLHILVFGWSYGTRMLVERLEAWEGVRRDVDWSVLDRR
jgi:hypothetical protein